MKDTFEKALMLVLLQEGGYINNKKDRSNMGIKQRVYEDWVGRKVDEAEMKALTVENVTPIYKRLYWHAVRADMLPAGIDFYVFEAAVMHEPRPAVKWLQKAVGCFDSGVVDLPTVSKTLLRKPTDIIKEMSQLRLSYLQKLPSWSTNGKKWAKRLEEVEEAALILSYPEYIEQTGDV